MWRAPRVYVDTSVFGGVFDPDFAATSKEFFEQARGGVLTLTVSALVMDELKDAPARVQSLFREMAPTLMQVEIDEAAYDLQESYLEAGVVGRKWETDALHVAIATVSGCRAIVSWNFKHIVNFRRISLYNGINQMRGYGPIAIHTPQEVVLDEND